MTKGAHRGGVGSWGPCYAKGPTIPKHFLLGRKPGHKFGKDL